MLSRLESRHVTGLVTSSGLEDRFGEEGGVSGMLVLDKL